MKLAEGLTRRDGVLSLAGVALDRALALLRRVEPEARACWIYDLDQVEARALRFRAAFGPLGVKAGYALKANALPALLARVRDAGLAAEAGSLGELHAAAGAGFAAGERILNGNGRTPEEAEFAAREGVDSINADHIEELDLLNAHAANARARLRVALRVNPGIATHGHAYVATGHDAAKFGVAPADALAAWAARERWPALRLDGLHLHVGSQIQEPGPLEAAADTAAELAAESARRGAPLGLVNLGGGFGVDYTGEGREFPLEAHAERIAGRMRALKVDWVMEPGRWIVATAGVLLAEVLWIKRRNGRRFVVLAAGMNDLIRPALYGAHHRIVPVRLRAGAEEPATVVGPVCESADVFEKETVLPPLERGDLVALLDAGAYGAVMSSNYNGRGRLAELVVSGGKLSRARAGEDAATLGARDRELPLNP
jgi:diaminopimelate decarboxylase